MSSEASGSELAVVEAANMQQTVNVEHSSSGEEVMLALSNDNDFLRGDNDFIPAQ